MLLLTSTRYPGADQSPHPTPDPLQAFPTAAESFDQPRGSRAASHFIRTLWSTVVRCDAAFEEHHAA